MGWSIKSSGSSSRRELSAVQLDLSQASKLVVHVVAALAEWGATSSESAPAKVLEHARVARWTSVVDPD
jgi:hypothetical protein